MIEAREIGRLALHRIEPRPARPIELPADVKAKFLPDADYARAKSVDWAKMETVQKSFVDRYLAEVR